MTTNTSQATNLIVPGPNSVFLSRYMISLPEAIASLTVGGNTTALTENYQPNYDYDVVCGRGRGSYNKPGNKRFRALVTSHIGEYLASKTKIDKTMVLNRIIDEVGAQNNGQAHFLKHDKSKGWDEMSNEQSRAKVGHAIREAIASREGTSSERESEL